MNEGSMSSPTIGITLPKTCQGKRGEERRKERRQEEGRERRTKDILGK